MNTKDKMETTNSLRNERRDRQTIKGRVAVPVALVLAVVLMAVVVGVAFYFKSFAKTNQLPNGQMAEKVTWRIRLFARKATGGVPDLSWSELWQMARQRRGFGLENLLQAAVWMAASRTDTIPTLIIKLLRTFSTRTVRCAMAAMEEGEASVQRLNQSGLRGGDSDLSIYKVLETASPTRLCVRHLFPFGAMATRRLHKAASNPSCRVGRFGCGVEPR